MRFEKLFFIISFFIFFSLQFIFILVLNYHFYEQSKYFIKDEIKTNLELCSYKLNCKDIKVDFVKKDTYKLLKLYETKSEFYMVFKIPNIKKYNLKLSMNKTVYQKQLSKVQNKIFYKLLIEVFIIIVLSLIFTMFLFYPLKKAYKINEIFLNDILHDFNTPLSTLKLNLFLLKKEVKNERIDKIEHNIKMILNYQQNLKNLLNNNPNQKEKFEIKEIIDQKLKFYSNSYPTIKYENKCNLKIETNKFLFESIIDNLISNAFKYNNKGGKIEIFCKDKKLYIKDTGKGIKDPKKVFDRFYKENERGIGIGMNIVKKFVDELGIEIKIFSKEGTIISLDLSKLTFF